MGVFQAKRIRVLKKNAMDVSEKVKGEHCLDSVHISYNWSFENQHFHVLVYRLWINLGARGGAFSSGGKIHSNPPKISVCTHSRVVCSTWQQRSLHFSYIEQAADEGWAKFTLLPPSLCTDTHSSCERLHLNWAEGHLNPTPPLQTPC